MPNWVGDLIMATAVLTDLRKAFPNSEITAMCKKPLGELLQHDPDVNELFAFERRKNEFSRRQSYRDIVQKIKEGKYDLGILLPNSFSSAWWFWKGSVSNRVGYSYKPRQIFLNKPVSVSKITGLHQVDAYKQLLTSIGISPSKAKPRLFLTGEEKEKAQQFLRTMGYEPGKKLIGINPGAAYGSAKCWPPDRFNKLAQKLTEEEDCYIAFFGDLSQKELLSKICSGLSEKVMNFVGATNLRELMALISLCDLFITNDSGPMHIASALNVPLIALFGSTDHTLTGPYFNERATIVNKQVSCSPCFKRSCPIDFRCMKEITVEEICQIVNEKLFVRGAHV